MESFENALERHRSVKNLDVHVDEALHEMLGSDPRSFELQALDGNPLQEAIAFGLRDRFRSGASSQQEILDAELMGTAAMLALKTEEQILAKVSLNG